jgi:hypothetical protein
LWLGHVRLSCPEQSYFQLFGQVQHKILGPPGGGDHAVGQSFPQFSFCCTCLLRAREVLLQSGGAADRHGAPDADQFPGSGIQYLFVVEIEKFLPDLHKRLPVGFPAIYYMIAAK